MVLRCSLLGHDYGEPEVEREREERGSEVVIVEREYEECTRCGDRHVITENTEVTSISQRTASSPTHEPESESDQEPSAYEPEDDAEFIDADAAGADPAGPARAEGGADAVEADAESVPTADDGEAIVDDGVILEDDEEPDERRRDRARGEWPEPEEVGQPTEARAEPTAWPDVDPADDRAGELESNGAVLESQAESDADGGRGAPDTGMARADPAPVPGEAGASDGVPTEFYCPGCEFVSPGDRGSLRPGDICPECRKGYLSERPR
ncbi:hypothetical protein ACFQGT_19880 [Natrialbaceae archaeon GCM10025810]|uniref:DUF7093 family protein n=1 Tax=Halovalidus salilacus TaxID=3075124 RepID=UPI00361AF515